MREGDLIRLKEPFTPTPVSLRPYYFGQVVALVTVGSNTAVLVYLCDRDGLAILTDEKSEPILYSFWVCEVEFWCDRASS